MLLGISLSSCFLAGMATGIWNALGLVLVLLAAGLWVRGLARGRTNSHPANAALLLALVVFALAADDHAPFRWRPLLDLATILGVLGWIVLPIVTRWPLAPQFLALYLSCTLTLLSVEAWLDWMKPEPPEIRANRFHFAARRAETIPDIKLNECLFVGEWSQLRDEVGFMTVPNARLRNLYPSNPRHYFQEFPDKGPLDPWHWRVEQFDGQHPFLERWESPPTAVARLQADQDGTDGGVRLHFRSMSLMKDRHYRLWFRGRSTSPVQLRVSIEVDVPGDSLCMEEGLVSIEGEQQPCWLEFISRANVATGSIALSLDDGCAEVEVSEARLEIVGPEEPVYPSFGVDYQLNAEGFRDQARPRHRPGEAHRIAVLGDSCTFGMGVKDEDLFTRRLEELVGRRHATKKIEVLNFGVSGFATEQERWIYHHNAKGYQPDVVLLMMTDNDDVSYLEEIRVNKELSQKQDPVSRIAIFNQILQSRLSASTRDFRNSIQHLNTLAEECRSEKRSFAVVLFHAWRSRSWTQLKSALAEHLDRAIPVLDLERVLIGSHRPEDLRVHDVDPHPNELAHRLAAEEIDRFLAERRMATP